MKLVEIGAGSRVFAPVFIIDAIASPPRNTCRELALVDLDLQAVVCMVAMAQRIATDCGSLCRITHGIEHWALLDGADFCLPVRLAAGSNMLANGLQYPEKRRVGQPGRECGGVGGLFNGLRSISLAMEVAKDVEKYYPGPFCWT